MNYQPLCLAGVYYDRNVILTLPGGIGWSEAVDPNGRRYFRNANTKSTSYVDPRTNMPTLMAAPAAPQNLPDGWLQATDPNGRIYFRNSILKTTSYTDPRTGQPTPLPTPNPEAQKVLKLLGLPAPQVKCPGGCGFYGTVYFGGYCSKCKRPTAV